MCQATVYLDGEVFMEDVMIVEPISSGIRLVALFEFMQVVPAVIRQIDLIKHKVILESKKNAKVNREQELKSCEY